MLFSLPIQGVCSAGLKGGGGTERSAACAVKASERRIPQQRDRVLESPDEPSGLTLWTNSCGFSTWLSKLVSTSEGEARHGWKRSSVSHRTPEAQSHTH
jgi:hypothetical protein